MDYCDYIADVAFHALLDAANQPDSLITDAQPPQLDLHSTEGWLQSTDKTIVVQDRNGQFYQITVEALGA